MGWNHPEISLAELIKLVKGFVDILILLSGYQSSGALALWDVTNITKAFEWAVFFETVFIQLKSSKDYEESLEALDEALSELKSDSSFPEGLAHLSSDSLIRPRNLIMQHIIHSLSLRDSHLKAVLTAVVQLDQNDHLTNYLDKLSFSQDGTLYSETSSTTEAANLAGSQWTNTASLELLERLSIVSRVSSLYTGFETFSRAIGTTFQAELFSPNMVRQQLTDGAIAMREDQIAQYVSWYSWKTRSLLYFLDKRTIRLVSGARLAFSSPKSQWLQAFEKPFASREHCQNNLHERVEILLLGCIADRWNGIIKHFQSVPFSCVTTLDRFYAFCNFLHGRCKGPSIEEERTNSKASTILCCLLNLVGTHLDILWKLSPALVAAAIPSWSPLLRLYLNEIEMYLRGGESTLLRPCCTEEKKEHQNCEVGERIWCLYVVHIMCSLKE